MLFQIVHMLMLLYCYTVCLYTILIHRHQNYGLWVVHVLVSSLGSLVFPLGYWLFFYPIKSDTLNIIHKIGKLCKCRLLSSGWHVESLNVSKFATAPKSNRITQPSHTYFFIPHPDNFTETSPAIISDTGYDSVNMMTESIT